jgi:hypothetical protein
VSDDADAGVEIRAEDARGGRIFLSVSRGEVVRDQLIEVDLRTGRARIVAGGMPFHGHVTFFPLTGELLQCSSWPGLIAVHPTTGAQRLLATAKEVGVPESDSGVRLSADVDPAGCFSICLERTDCGGAVGTRAIATASAHSFCLCSPFECAGDRFR